MASSKRKPAKKTAKRRASPEKKLQYICQQWLEKSGLWDRMLIFHVPNERKGGIGAILHFKRMGVRAGVADYLAFPPGCRAAIELKDEDGKQRQGQEKFQQDWEKSGGSYFVARTLEEFQGIVNALVLFA